jgi:peptidyl-prolyl cis-trans isomerase SurA
MARTLSNLRAAAAAIAALWLIAQAGAAAAATVGRVVAVVNDEVVTEAQLEKAIAAHARNAGQKGQATDRSRILDRLINERLMGQLTDRSSVKVTEDDLARAIANVLQQSGMTIDQLRAEIASKGMSYEDYKHEMESQIKRIKFVNQVIGPQVKISDQDLRDYYARNQERFRGTSRAHIAQIFLPFEGITTEAEAEALKHLALSISAKGGTGFREMARQHSKGPAAENGGDLGVVELKDLPPAVAGAVRIMKVGEVSPPIPTENGLMIVKLISLPEMSASDFEDARDSIYSALYERRIEETLDSYLQRERQRAYIEIY